jgi:hypothetical protein
MPMPVVLVMSVRLLMPARQIELVLKVDGSPGSVTRP